VICLIEGVYYGLGFALVGLPYGFLLGFLLGVLNLVPLFGTVVCLPIALPLAYFGGGSVTRLVLVLSVWAIGQLLDGYCITPKIQGNKTGLGYAGVIFSFFFWGTVLGPVLGLLLAIPLSAFCAVLWRALKSKYIRPVV
jgi:predicted PurR-regulated permease PerM